MDDAEITEPIIINKPVTIITKKSVPAKVEKGVKVTIKDDENSEGKEVIGKGKDQEIELEPKGDVSDPVDKSELESKIAEVMKLNKEDYTEKTWSILEVALDMPEATQEEVDAKVKAIDEAIKGLAKVSYSFEANLNKTEFNIGEDITITGKALKDESGLANVHIAITVVTDGNQLVTMNEVTTDKNGEFSHTFKVPKETEAGTYKLKVQANQPVNKAVELDLVMVEEPKPEVKVTFNHTEYTVEVGGYIPEKGDLIVTTTGLEDDEIESVTIKSSDKSIVKVTQRPVWVEGGFPKSKTRAYGKAIAPGQASIIATVTAKDGKEYTSECKVIVKAKEQKTEVELYYCELWEGTLQFTINPITIPDRAYYFKVIVGDKESDLALIHSEYGVMFNDITIEEVEQAGEVTVQFFYDDQGKEKVGEVQVTPIPYE